MMDVNSKRLLNSFFIEHFTEGSACLDNPQRQLALLPLCLLIGYTFVWFSHFVIEKNKSTTFKNPLWSFISDHKMMFFILMGKMITQVERVQAKMMAQE